MSSLQKTPDPEAICTRCWVLLFEDTQAKLWRSLENNRGNCPTGGPHVPKRFLEPNWDDWDSVLTSWEGEV